MSLPKRIPTSLTPAPIFPALWGPWDNYNGKNVAKTCVCHTNCKSMSSRLNVVKITVISSVDVLATQYLLKSVWYQRKHMLIFFPNTRVAGIGRSRLGGKG